MTRIGAAAGSRLAVKSGGLGDAQPCALRCLFGRVAVPPRGVAAIGRHRVAVGIGAIVLGLLDGHRKGVGAARWIVGIRIGVVVVAVVGIVRVATGAAKGDKSAVLCAVLAVRIAAVAVGGAHKLIGFNGPIRSAGGSGVPAVVGAVIARAADRIIERARILCAVVLWVRLLLLLLVVSLVVMVVIVRALLSGAVGIGAVCAVVSGGAGCRGLVRSRPTLRRAPRRVMVTRRSTPHADNVVAVAVRGRRHGRRHRPVRLVAVSRGATRLFPRRDDLALAARQRLHFVRVGLVRIAQHVEQAHVHVAGKVQHRVEIRDVIEDRDLVGRGDARLPVFCHRRCAFPPRGPFCRRAFLAGLRAVRA